MTSENFTGWRKASYSAPNGDCVQVGWRTSSYSGGNGTCVQVAMSQRIVGVRDTKEHGRGPVLEFPEGAWLSFISAAKSGAFR